MGVRGPAPKPAATRQRRNTRPQLALIPAPEKPVIPRPPAKLLASSRKAWRAYWESDVAQAADRKVDLPRIERWITTLDEYQRVTAVFKTARLVKGSTGQPALNPLASYLATLLAELKAAENDLGLSPMARLRLGIVYGQARLTAEELNPALDERMDEPVAVEEWEADWEDAP